MSKNHKKISRPINLTIGSRFNNLIFIKCSGVRNKKRIGIWKCDCGKLVEARVENVKSGNTKSCGCRRTKLSNMWRTPTYYSWESMLSRCENKNHKNYKNYGGRGIKVCERWRDFNNFFADMGERPSVQHQIDRINNDQGYEPENCMWVLASENIRKKMSTKLTTKEVKQIKDLQERGESNVSLARAFGVSSSTICDIRHGRSWTDV